MKKINPHLRYVPKMGGKAEGVEHGEELALLVQMGCDVVQGYYISAPVTAGNFAALVRQRAAGMPLVKDSRQGG